MGLIPAHVAIIMDGNGRWAKARGHVRIFGHVRGSSRVKPIVKAASQLGIKALSLYAFSTENWNRPSTELEVLWKLLKRYLKSEQEELHRENVKLRIIGQVDRLAPSVREVMEQAVERLSKNTGLNLNLCISYGSRAEILDATRKIASECKAGKLDPKDIDEKLFERFLWTQDLGSLSQVDLVIRTSGEKRVSNFLLWQSAYAEYCFYDLAWPDFSEKHLHEAVEEFGKRDRRFGGLK